MQSFLAYVAEQYGRKKEDVATDALAYLLNRYEPVRAAFGRFIADCGYTLATIDSIDSRTRGAHGVPDLQISDGAGSCCAIVENKFWADLTPHQPLGYFETLRDDGGLILFVVPKARIPKLWSELQELCRNANRTIEPLPGNKFLGRSAAHHIGVVSWDQLIDHLEAGCGCAEVQDTEALIFIDQLRRTCDMAEKEKFENLTPDAIDGRGISTLVRHLTWITQQLITRCIAQNVVQEITGSPRTRENKMRADSDLSLFFGQNLLLCGVKVWMGFWALAWEDRSINPKSPLWISLNPRDAQVNQIITRLKETRGEGIAAKRQLNGDEYWLIPIPLKPNIPQDEVVREACEYVAALKAAIC